MLFTILIVVQVLVSLSLVGLILVQQGKGADAGAAFGSGASGTVFGAQGAANFLSRATGTLATAFFVISLALAYLVGGNSIEESKSVTEQVQIKESSGKALNSEQQKTDQTKASDKSKSGQPQKTGEDKVPSPESLPK